MSHLVRVNTGCKAVALPDGKLYDGLVDVTLTDAEFNALHPNAFTSGLLTDLGAVVDPNIDASFATDTALATEATARAAETTRATTAESAEATARTAETSRATAAESAESTARTAADTTEASARGSADTTEATTRATADTAEAAARAALVSDGAYSATTWDGDTTHAPSKNAVRDEIEVLSATSLHVANNLSDVASVLTALQNLGIDRSGITDGQLLAWNASLSKLLPVNPTGNSELAYAENASGTTTTVTGASGTFGTNTDITGVSITVPISARPVYIEVGFQAVQTTTGAGYVNARLQEVGGSTFVAQASIPLPNTVESHSAAFSLRLRRRLGATVAARTFKLQVAVAAATGVNPVIAVQNGAFAVIPSYILAEAL